MSGNVVVRTFFSKTYIDDEMRRLTREFKIHEIDGRFRSSTLGKFEIESLVARVLGLVLIDAANPISLVGVRKDELEAVAKRADENWFIEALIEDGFLREEFVVEHMLSGEKPAYGNIVIFPTEKLLENQRISRR